MDSFTKLFVTKYVLIMSYRSIIKRQSFGIDRGLLSNYVSVNVCQYLKIVNYNYFINKL